VQNMERKTLNERDKSVSLLKLFAMAVIYASSIAPTAYAMQSEEGETTKHLILKKGKLHWGDSTFDCSWGKNGTTPAKAKREGDGKTPEGSFLFRRVFYRPDRVEKIETYLTLQKITKGEGGDGWCDQPNDTHYNESVTLPYKGSHEELWREDGLYDIILVVGYNDSPVVSEPPMGSAIFVHIRRPDGGPTSGCVSLERNALLSILKEAKPDSRLIVEPQEQ